MKTIIPGGIVRALITLGLVSYQTAPALATNRTATASTQVQWVTQLIVKEKTGTLRTQSIAAGSAVARADVATVQRWAAAAQLPVTYKRPMSGGAHVVTLPAVMSLDDAQTVARRMESSGQFEFVSPDKIMRPASVPSDPRFGNQWNLWPSVAGAGGATNASTGGANLTAAWDASKGTSTTNVAVIDTGILTNHEDLAGAHIRAGYDFVSNDALTGVQDPTTHNTIPNGFAENDSTAGRDSDPSDPGDWVSSGEAALYPNLCGGARNSSWHGTFVTGQIVAQHNSVGIAGIAPNVSIQMARALGKCGGTTSDIMDALAWVTGASGVPGAGGTALPVNSPMARVVNMSLGGAGACSSIEQTTITAARARGAVIAVATGNDGVNTVGAPANCNGVIAVTAHTTDGDTASYANLGAETTISAPGGGSGIVVSGSGLLVSSISNDGPTSPSSNINIYANEAGTSMATPHVAGVAALLLSYNPSLSVDDVINVLKQSARAYPTNSYCATHASICGAGLLDAGAAMSMVAPKVQASASASSIVANNAVTLTATGSAGYASTIASVQWTQTAGDTVALTTAGPDANGHYTATFTPTSAGTYAFTVKLTSSANIVTTASTQVAVTAAATSGGTTGGTAAPASSGGGGGGYLPLWLAGLLMAFGAFGYQRRKVA